jgi:hypothetical protein
VGSIGLFRKEKLCPSVVHSVMALATFEAESAVLVMVKATLMCGSLVICVAALAKYRRPLTATNLVAPDVAVTGDGGIRSI